MLKRLKTFCTSRSTVLVLILLLTASLTVAALVPQLRGERPASKGAGSTLSWLVDLLGLDHVFSTWWFVGLSFVFVLSLFISTFDQYVLTRKKLTAISTGEDGYARCSQSVEKAADFLRSQGYRLLCKQEDVSRYVKGAGGYWGNFFLHLGLAVSVAFSLVYVLTEHRVIVRAIEQERVVLRSGQYAERKGFFAGSMSLPDTIVLEGLDPEFHENDAVKHVASRLLFSRGNSDRQSLRVGQSDKQNYHGLIVYQQNTFGMAFELVFTESGSRQFRKLVALPMPLRRDAAAYGKMELDDRRYLLKAKFFPNADKTGMIPRNPQLLLRLQEGESLVGEAALLRGESVRLGPYEVRLAEVRWWSDILFEGSRGMVGIFAGFAILLWGGVLSFFVVPREVLLRRVEEGVEIRWRAARFHHFYLEEYVAITASCVGENSVEEDSSSSIDEH